MSAQWKVEEALAEDCGIDLNVSTNLVQLIEGDHTMPFIARYRKHLTGDIDVPKLREVFQRHVELRKVQSKIATTVASLIKQEKLNPSLKHAVCSARSTDEVDHLYAPFKPGGSKTKAAKARELGLEPAALEIMEGLAPYTDLTKLRCRTKEGTFLSVAQIRSSIQDIVADMVSKNPRVLEFVRNLCKKSYITLKTAEKKTKQASAKGGLLPKRSTKAVKRAEPVKEERKNPEAEKYRTYMDFTASVHNIKPYQVMAINRAESKKFITVKVIFPDDHLQRSLVNYSLCQWLPRSQRGHADLMKQSIEDAYSRLIQPMLARGYRSHLTRVAEGEAVASFATNLRRLLLVPPLRGETILALDPGFHNGCKTAVIDHQGSIVEVCTLYLHTNRDGSVIRDRKRLGDLLSVYGVKVVAIGNGTASRQTEQIVSDVINEKRFKEAGIKYCVVSEDGASIYSCSPLAEQEMPDIDQNLRSAVSIARRLQDPLAELVKIDAKHLGVGMYQHDVSETLLKAALSSTVVECVSFVGADLNTASETLLSHIAGLSATRAKAIIKHREASRFNSREELRKVKGIGEKSFEQCAGFLRINDAPLEFAGPGGSGDDYCSVGELKKGKRQRASDKDDQGPAKKKARKTKNTASVAVGSPLDTTSIHPEAYSMTLKLLERVFPRRVSSLRLGSKEMVRGVSEFREREKEKLAALSKELGTDSATLELSLDALGQPAGNDFREDFEKPLFRSGCISIHELKHGDSMSGVVRNVTGFGAFVDLGVGTDGLIHTSKSRGISLELGSKVKVKVESIDLHRSRISLALETLF